MGKSWIIKIQCQPCEENWRARRESNPQPSDPKSDALSIELRAPLLLYSTIPSQIVNLLRDTA